LFVDNLLDTHTVVNYAWSIPNAVTDVDFGGQNRNLRDYTFRPRTFGLTFIFRK
jgi:hypothetical protein